MKTLVTIALLFLGLGFQSCQSEYAERMAKAIDLKKKHSELTLMMQESENPGLKTLISDLEQEIYLQAKISGNEDLFLKELWKH